MDTLPTVGQKLRNKIAVSTAIGQLPSNTIFTVRSTDDRLGYIHLHFRRGGDDGTYRITVAMLSQFETIED